MIPSLPPHRRALARLGLAPLLVAGALAGGLGYLRHIWPEPRAFVAPRDRAPVTLMSVSADPMWTASVAGHRCLAFLDDFLRRPSWTINLSSGATSCVGETRRGTLTVDAGGDAMWRADNLPARPMHLTPRQIAVLHAAAFASCWRPAETYGRYSSRFVDVHWGGRDAAALRVPESLAQALLDAFIDDAVAQYRHRRLAERADLRATVRLEPHAAPGVHRRTTLTFDAAGALVLRVGRRTITAPPLDDATRVDTIDWIDAGAPSFQMPPRLREAIDHATHVAGLQD